MSIIDPKMAPVSITTALLDLVAVVGETAAAVATFCRRSRDARSDLLAMTGELAQLQLVLDLLREDTAVIDDGAIPEDVHNRALSTIGNCSNVIEEINKTLGGCERSNRGLQWTFAIKAEVDGQRELLKAHRDTLHMALDAVALLAVKCLKGAKSQVSVTVHDVGSDSEEVIDVCTAVTIPSTTGDQDLGIIKNTGAVTMYTEEPPHDPRSQWDDIFETLDQDSNGIINGDEAVPFFQQFNLPSQTLAEIWDQADEGNRGYLTKGQFAHAMELIQRARHDQLFNELDAGGKGYLLGTEASPFFEQSCLPVETLGRIWQQVDKDNKGFLSREEFGMVLDLIRGERLVEPEDKARFDEVFARLDADGKGMIRGEEACVFLSNSKLPDLVLGQIWELADVDTDGYLTKDEFAVAMYMIKQQRMGVTRLPKVVIRGVRFFDS